MTEAPIESVIPETASCENNSRRFMDLRGVQWRINLGILPSSPDASIDDLRRVTANSRRRYAALRRQLLVDPHVPKDGSNSPDLFMDNPLSQNPDSMWGRFFKNAELERMVDQDLTRLYPERGSYFQTNECQGMLRRMLLLWCLRNPECGYRQGMHELLAPLLYVLHVDVQRLSEVRKTHEDHFTDKFDGFSFHENDLTYKFDFKKFSESDQNVQNSPAKSNTLGELEPEIQTIVLLNDAYGAEGELGVVLSEKFMEHDVYSMFDALMNGSGGALSMADFFSPFGNSPNGPPPVIEASAAMYHLLSMVDSSLHSHLVELGVEPQYFSLRWLRVLFGREFSLESLLVIWDEIFSCENTRADNCDTESNFRVLSSARGAFVSAFSVSMILELRSSLLATEHATTCLKRLLNFPDDVNLLKLITKAKSLLSLAVEANKISNSFLLHTEFYDRTKPVAIKGHSLSLDLTSPTTPLNDVVPDSYWEEKWRNLQKEEKEQVPSRKKGWSEKVRFRLSRTESEPSPSNKKERKQIPKAPVRRNLLRDLEQQLGFEDDKEISHQDPLEVNEQDNKDSSVTNSEENSSNSSNSEENSSFQENSDNENDSESSVASNSLVDEKEAESNERERSPAPGLGTPDGLDSKCDDSIDKSSTMIDKSSTPDGLDSKCDNLIDKSSAVIEKRPPLSGKFQWLWKFGRNGNEGTSEKKVVPDDATAGNGGGIENDVSALPTADECDSSVGIIKGETVDQNLMVSLRNLGQSMLENIQVLESVFPQDRGQMGSMENLSKNVLVGKGQVTAMAALKELRKISNLLSEM